PLRHHHHPHTLRRPPRNRRRNSRNLPQYNQKYRRKADENDVLSLEETAMSADDFYHPQPWEQRQAAPEGWIELPSPGGFNHTFGPVHATRDGPGTFAVGFRC